MVLESVETPEGQPGQEIDLTLRGDGFTSAPQSRLIIPDINVLWMKVISDGLIQARTSIPDDTPPGPRTIEIVAIFEDYEEIWARLENGFRVLEQNRPPPQVRLEAVEPPEGQPGREAELILWGRGFREARHVQVIISDLNVLQSEVISDEQIRAWVSIPEETLPGPRAVEIVAIFGENTKIWAGPVDF